MSDYTKVYDGAALDTAEATVAGADFDVEFDALEVAVATKANKVGSPTDDNILTMDSSGDLKDSGEALSLLTNLPITSKIVTSAPQTLTTGYVSITTSIPTWARRVVVLIENLKNTTGGDVAGVRVGDSGGLSTTYVGENHTTSTITVDNWGGRIVLGRKLGNVVSHFMVTMQKQSGNEWLISLQGTDSDASHIGVGRVTGLSSDLDRVSVLGGSGIVSGTAVVSYE